jgi:hypothetical protein
MKSGQIPKIEETLKSLALTSKITTKYSISSMNIVMPKDERDITHYKELAKVLTNKYGIKSTVYYFNPISNKFDQCLSISPGDYEATIYNDLQHLGETQPYNDKKLQSCSHHFDFACDVFKLSAINHSVGAVFVHLHDGGFCWVFEGEFTLATLK